MTDILFVSYGGSHSLMLKGIYKIILEKKTIDTKYLALTAARDSLNSENLPYDDIDIFIENKKKLFEILQKFSIEQSEKNYYLALSLKELIDEVGEIKAKELFELYGRSIFCQKELAKKILKYYNPKILVTSNLIRLPRALYLVSKELGIKTVYIEDMFMVPEHKYLESSKTLINLAHPYINIDKIIVFSKQAISIAKSNLKKNHILNVEEIVPLGNPNLENSMNKFNTSHLIEENNYYLYLSNLYERESATDLLVKYFKKNKNKRLIIKTHPLEDKYFYIKKFSTLDNVKIQQDNLIDLISGAQYVLGTNSTALLESNIMGKKVFSININNSILIKELFIDTKIANEIKNLNDLENLEKFSNNEQVKIEVDSENKIANYLEYNLKGL